MTPELDTDSVEILKLFGAMDEKTKQIMLVQMRGSCKILIFWRGENATEMAFFAVPRGYTEKKSLNKQMQY